MLTLESSVLSAWYSARPEIRRLRAIRDTEGLRVFVELEPVQDSNETHPVWIANRTAWTRELAWHTGTAVRLEHALELLDEAGSGRVVVADLAWRDPSFPI
jgi:hypothetical protein